MLEPTGKLGFLARLARTADDQYRFDIDAGAGDDLATRLRRFLLRTKATVEQGSLLVSVGSEQSARRRRPTRRLVGRGSARRRRRRRPRRGPARGRVRSGAHRRRLALPRSRARRRRHPRRDRRRPRRGQLHQGLLHRPGARRPHRQPWRQRAQAPPPARADGASGGRRPDHRRWARGRRRHLRRRYRRPRVRAPQRVGPRRRRRSPVPRPGSWSCTRRADTAPATVSASSGGPCPPLRARGPSMSQVAVIAKLPAAEGKRAELATRAAGAARRHRGRAGHEELHPARGPEGPQPPVDVRALRRRRRAHRAPGLGGVQDDRPGARRPRRRQRRS